MHFRDIFLFFVGVTAIGLSLANIFPEWAMYLGTGALVIMVVRLVLQGIKSKVQATPFRPSIEDLEDQRRKKAEAEARKKILADELKRSKETGNNGMDGFQ